MRTGKKVRECLAELKLELQSGNVTPKAVEKLDEAIKWCMAGLQGSRKLTEAQKRARARKAVKTGKLKKAQAGNF